jgi:NAD(P)-dependent dehydrogenase (short-subunit alcohol dehydrogenase family)
MNRSFPVDDQIQSGFAFFRQDSRLGLDGRGHHMANASRDRKEATATAARQRRLQRAAEAKESKESKAKPSTPKRSGKAGAAPKQAGTRRQPVNPMPAQHLSKPGREAELDLAPKFLAPDYRGSAKLEGRVALITGGDSGIGRAVAVLFAREGADVAIVYLDEHDDARLTCEYIEAEGGRSLAIPGDVRDPAFCKRAVAGTIGRFGKLDVLVNNAAFQQHVARIEDISDAQFDETMRTNVYGYFNMARAAVPHLGAGAAIINNGSVTGLFGSAELLDYATTKGAIHAFTQALASNLVSKGIRVNAVAPGPVWTPLNPADRAADEITDFGADNPMGRPAQPEELSPAFVFLASPACSSYITGAILPVMGGPKG